MSAVLRAGGPGGGWPPRRQQVQQGRTVGGPRGLRSRPITTTATTSFICFYSFSSLFLVSFQNPPSMEPPLTSGRRSYNYVWLQRGGGGVPLCRQEETWLLEKINGETALLAPVCFTVFFPLIQKKKLGRSTRSIPPSTSTLLVFPEIPMINRDVNSLVQG